MKLSYSAIAAFLHCRRQYYYEYVLGLAPRRENPAFFIGTGVHAGLEGYARGQDAHSAYTLWYHAYCDANPPQDEETRERREQDYTLSMGMLSNYREWEREQPPLRTLATEFEFAVPLPETEDGFLAGRIDGLVEDEWGDVYLLEYKTADSFYPTGHLDLNLQSSLYQWAIRTMQLRGELPFLDNRTLAGVYFITLKKAVPKEPELLKSGKGLSKAVSTGTTHTAYLHAIQQYGFSPDDYTDHLDKLAAQGHPFVRCEVTLRSDRELAQVESDLIDIHAEMERAERWFPTPTKYCPRYCAFYQPCVNRRKGDDENYTLHTQYHPKTREELLV